MSAPKPEPRLVSGLKPVVDVSLKIISACNPTAIGVAEREEPASRPRASRLPKMYLAVMPMAKRWLSAPPIRTFSSCPNDTAAVEMLDASARAPARLNACGEPVRPRLPNSNSSAASGGMLPFSRAAVESEKPSRLMFIAMSETSPDPPSNWPPASVMRCSHCCRTAKGTESPLNGLRSLPVMGPRPPCRLSGKMLNEKPPVPVRARPAGFQAMASAPRAAAVKALPNPTASALGLAWAPAGEARSNAVAARVRARWMVIVGALTAG